MPPSNQRIQEFPLTFEGGLVTEVEDSTLEVGQAASLVNWVPTAQGGLRARNRWSGISTLGLPAADYKVRGWGVAAVGGAAATASVVQVASDPTQLQESSKSATLNGCISGNIIVAVITTQISLNADPSSISAGYTKVAEFGDTGGTDMEVIMYSKVSAGGDETFTATHGTPAISHLTIYELGNVSSPTPSDSDGNGSASPFTLSCDSPGSAGVAISAGIHNGSGSWATEPGNGGSPADTGWTTNGTTIDVSIPVNSIVASKVFADATVTDQIDPSPADSDALMAIWEEAPSSATPAQFYILIAIATSTGYSVYRIIRDSIQAGTWELVDSATCDDTSAFVSMAVGAGTLVWSASTMDVPRSVVLSTLTGADVTDLDTLSGRAVVYHKDRMFVGGSSGEASRMYFSDIGDPTSFTTVTDFLDVGGDDGEAIEDLLSVEGLLLVCKTNRLYLISGSGIETFITNELPGGSAATGRPAVRTPYGTVVVGPEDIWVVQGGGVDPMSRSLGEGFSISGLVSTAYAQDVVLVCDSGSGNVFRVNLVTGAWQLEEVTEGENEPGHLFSLQGRLYYGVLDSETQVGGTRRLSSSRSFDFTGGTNYEASTGKLALLGPSVTYTPRFLYLQLRNQDPSLPNSLFVTITTDIGEEEQGFMVTEDVQRERIDLGRYRGASWIQVSYRSDSSAIAGAIDVEKGVLGAIVDGGH